MAVVGAGINGLCTAYRLSSQSNLKILLLEQYDLAHSFGSSHSKIRITRAAYPDPLYVQMAQESRNVEWPQLEKDFGEKLVLANNFLAFGHDDIYLTYRNRVQQMNLPTLTITSGVESQKLCPALKLDQFKDVVMDTNAGIILAEKTVSLLIQDLKLKKNVTIMQQTKVEKVIPGDNEVVLVTNKKEYKVGKVVLTIGRWASDLIPDIKSLVHVNKQFVLYLKLKTDKGNTEIGKYYSWMGSHDGEEYYSLPSYATDWIKVAQHDNVIGKPKLTPEKQTEKVVNYIKTVLGYEIEGIQRTEECYYTSTPNEEFIIDFLDEKKRILASSTCSGHAFKFGPLVGRILSDLIQTGTTSVQLFRDNKFRFCINYHMGVNLRP